MHTHRLHTKELVESFAENGLVCAVLEPSSGEEIGDTILKAAKRADIVVLDWKIHESYGETSLGLIRKIKEEDSSDRLRLIAIYTGENDLSGIADAVKSVFEGEVIVDRGSLFFSAGAISISIMAKERTSVNPEFANRVLKEADLPQRLIQDFSTVTAGIMSNTVLEAYAAIRSTAHCVLSKFSPEMDAPYLAHRALVNPPEEAEMHVVPLIMSEIEAVLDGESKVRQHLSVENVEAWIQNEINSDECRCDAEAVLKDTEETSKDLATDILKKIVVEGVSSNSWKESAPGLAEFLKPVEDEDKSELSRLTGLFCAEGQCERLDRDFAALTSIKSAYGSSAPILQLGAIVAKVACNNNKETTKSYHLCVQPLCDSVRLSRSSGRMFPFLKMKEIDPAKGKMFAVISQGDGTHLELGLSLKGYESALIKFKPKVSNSPIVALEDEGGWYFQSTEPNMKYRWLGNLKLSQAQRVANNLAHELSRVGLTESDWLRRMAK